MNYRLMHNAVSLIHKVKTLEEKNKCELCKCDKNESRNHLFIECAKVKELFAKIKYKLKNKNLDLKSETNIYFMGLEYEDSRVISIYNMSIWRLRNIVKDRNVGDIDKCFMGVFKYLSFTNK